MMITKKIAKDNVTIAIAIAIVFHAKKEKTYLAWVSRDNSKREKPFQTERNEIILL